MNGHTSSPDIRAAQCVIEHRQAFLARLRCIGKEFCTSIILFNADMLSGRRHAESAVRFARRSWDGGSAIANTFEMEALLYAAGSRQCNVGFKFGIHEGENRLFVCCEPGEADGAWDALSDLIEYVDADIFESMDQEKRERLADLFGITSPELESIDSGTTITDLVLERVALLQVLR
jgi:KEOPS complex subunit Cgi121